MSLKKNQQIGSFLGFMSLLVGCMIREPSGGPLRDPTEEPQWISVLHDEKAQNYNKITRILDHISPNSDEFLHLGPVPFKVETVSSLLLPRGQSLSYDKMIPQKKNGRGPPVILVHGNRSYKEAHRYQGEHLASFGFQVYIPQLPTTEVWPTNGILLKEFIEVVAPREKPVLVGHSFGGTAVAMAAYLGARVSGLVFLDPAVFNQTVTDLLPATKIPAILLGADPSVYRAKKRTSFRQLYGGSFYELSLKGATHNDAQNPTMFALSHYGLDPVVSPKNQKMFMALLTASVFSLVDDHDHQFIHSVAKKLEKKKVVFDLFRRGPLTPPSVKQVGRAVYEP